MFNSRIEHKHWVNVAIRFLTDLLLFYLAFQIAMAIRFGDDWWEALLKHWHDPVAGALTGSALLYICGYYITRTTSRLTFQTRGSLLVVIVGASGLAVLVTPYIFLETPLGRGVWLIGMGFSYLFLSFHHIVLSYIMGRRRLAAAIMITSAEDETEAIDLYRNCREHIDIKGFITYGDVKLKTGELLILGSTSDASDIAQTHNLDRVICTNRGMAVTALFRKFCELQYLGVTVSSVINVYEEFHQICPIEELSSEWILQASTAPQILYIRKLKRTFDIVVSLIGLICLGPVMLLGMLLLKLFESGPVFYKQTRLGRFGRKFEVIKLRTMTVDAEKGGAQWSAKGDPRITALGRIFRKYRIDEVPQFFNILRGEMSFVGPRPERPEFTDQLSESIPFFLERLLVQPGLTGWAQVNYPYGESVEDARRKLEYDLYYIKHMSTFMDMFILLDTIRIIITGGSRKPPQLTFSRPTIDTPLEEKLKA